MTSLKINTIEGDTLTIEYPITLGNSPTFPNQLGSYAPAISGINNSSNITIGVARLASRAISVPLVQGVYLCCLIAGSQYNAVGIPISGDYTVKCGITQQINNSLDPFTPLSTFGETRYKIDADVLVSGRTTRLMANVILIVPAGGGIYYSTSSVFCNSQNPSNLTLRAWVRLLSCVRIG